MTPDVIYAILTVAGPLVGLIVKHRWPDLIPFLQSHTSEEKLILGALRDLLAKRQQAQSQALLTDLLANVAQPPKGA